MALGNFIKDNLALVAGIAVPALLVAGFLATSTVGRMLTPPPAHIAYFVMQQTHRESEQNFNLGITVGDDGRISVSITPIKEGQNGYPPNAQSDILVSYNAATNTLREHRFTQKTGITEGTFTPDDFKTVQLGTDITAPDGYQVNYGGGGRHSFVTDIFVAHRADGYRIRKGAAVYRLPEHMPDANNSVYYNRYYSLRFLGWAKDVQQ